MDDRRDVTQGLDPIAALAYIAAHDFNPVFVEQSAQFRELVHPMDLRAEIVHQAHLHAALDECPGKRQTDEP
jgi:hypothetical protein